MLEIQGLNQFYGGSHTLWDVDMTVPTGSCTCLMGRNGMGKTTLLKCVMGLLPSTGRILYEGRDIRGLPAEDRAHLRIGYVPQGREIFSQLTVEENLRIGLAARRPRLAEVPEQIFQMFPVLKQMLRRRGGDLSGGQQQQLAIARALLAEPKLIIFDEPTEGIQPSIIKDIERVIRLLRARGDMAILLCEQYFDFAHALADKFIVLSRGEVVAAGVQADMNNDDVKRHLAV